MKRFLAGVALSTLLFASGANAATYEFTLTGDMANFTTNSFMAGNVLYETGFLELTGFTPFTLQDGDTIHAVVDINGGTFTLPVRDSMFFGLNFDNILGGAHPEDSSASGTFSFDGGGSVGAGCGNCVSLIYGQDNAPLSFTHLDAEGGFVLPGAYEVNHITISYQVNNSGAPEPAGWALMILGFGGAGAMLRRRRNTDTFAAA